MVLVKKTCIASLLNFFLVFGVVQGQTIKIATFNTSLNRTEKGALLQELITDKKSEQLANVAEIIQRTKPDILVLQEFDYDEEDRALRLFEEKYLAVGQNGANSIDFPYFYLPETNTGYNSGEDLDNDGKYDGPGDAFGYGAFPGQYGFLILSKYPIVQQHIRTFQHFLWKDMPNAMLPVDKEGKEFYAENELNVLRLSSKNHIDVPVLIGSDTVHILASHPTPPVFDGDEDRNGKRNYDEIRLWSDYISGGEKAAYLYDDKGKKGGLKPVSKFVICGDQNADPFDGDSYKSAIDQLLKHPRIYQGLVKGKYVPSSKGGIENAKTNEEAQKSNSSQDDPNIGNPANDTSGWGLRVDYVLPSANLKIVDSGIFWPKSKSKYGNLVAPYASSDHRLVWVEISLD